MKRVGHLYDRCFTLDALHAAYLRAAHGKHATRACFRFTRALGANLQALHDELQTGTYRPRPYYRFEVSEPKRRVIYAPAFRDLVVQHAIYAVVLPVFEPTFIDQSFACRVGRGTHACADYAQHALQQVPRDSYVLKIDVRKFFYRIDRAVLRRLFESRIKDARLVALMCRFADHGEPRGIPIGNLLSQLYALIYLNPLDHFIKRELKVRRYCRYVDDGVLFGLTHQQAIDYRARIEVFLSTLGLEYSHTSITRASRGINFVGYRTWASKRFVRKRALYNFRRSVRRGQAESIVSHLGHVAHTHSRNHLLHTLQERRHDLYCQLSKNHHARAQWHHGATIAAAG